MKRFNQMLLCGASAAVLTFGAGLSANAQDAPPAQDGASSDKVEKVTVTGVRRSLKNARDRKKASDKVTEQISADEIGQLPDVTIAESLVRLPGLNGTRDRGNESQAVVRGLGARLVLGTINGREVASSEPDRNIRWEVYPSEVVSGVEVFKSQSADLIAGGVAGTINIITVDPLSYKGPTLIGRAGPVYYEKGADIPNYDPWGYRASGSYVTQLSDDFAIAIGGSSQLQKNAYPSFQGWGYNDGVAHPGNDTGDLNGDGTDDPTPWGAQTEVKKLDQDRTGIMGAASWAPSDDFKLRFDVLYSDIVITENSDQTWFSRNGVWGNWANGSAGVYNGAGSSYTLIDGDVVAATLANGFSSVTNVVSHYDEDKTLFVTGLNAGWSAEEWEVKADLSYSKAERDNTWQAVLMEHYPATMSFDTREGIRPFLTVSFDTGDPTIQVAQNYLSGIHDGPEHLGDELVAGAFDVTRALGGSFFDALAVGLRVSDRTKDHSRFNWSQSTRDITGDGFADNIPIPANLLYSYQVEGFNVPRIVTGDFYQLANVAYGGFNPALASENLLQRWEVNEGVFEAYAMATMDTEMFGLPMRGNVGARLVNVDTESKGFQSIAGGPPTAATVEHDYSEILPSLSLNFSLTEDQLLRFGAAKVIARPPLDELRVSRQLSDPLVPPLSGSDGNPKLDPFKATQFDVSYEWYFHSEALLAVAAYYKDVDTHIGYAQQVVSVNGLNYLITGPFNGGGGEIKGLEFTFQTPFYFIPGLEDFGVYSNYAYVDSNIKEFAPVNNPLDVSGLAEHTAVIDLWYNNGPMEVRLGYKYHSPFTVIYGWDGSDLRTLEEESTFDASASYQILENVGLKLQVNNLTDEPLRIYRDNKPNRLGRYDEYGRRVLFDVTVTF